MDSYGNMSRESVKSVPELFLSNCPCKHDINMMRKVIIFLLAATCCCMVDVAQNVSNKLVKLPFAFSETGRTPMENTPVLFQNKLLLVLDYRPGGFEAKGEDAYLYVMDLRTGQEVARFGKGHSFVSAFVRGNELHVFALEFSNFGRIIKSKGINHFVTSDLKKWDVLPTAISPDSGEKLFNSSVCSDKQGYIMAYETDNPVQFCFKFARSKDLLSWTKIPDIVFTGEKNEYSACPVIRYYEPYYYVIYLHAPTNTYKGYISYLIRSKDLKKWQLSSLNPILKADEGEGINNSDVDLIEYKNKTYLYYATGDQMTWGTIRVALFNGSERKFFESYFPKSSSFSEISAIKQDKNGQK